VTRPTAFAVLAALSLWAGRAGAEPLELAALRVKAGFEKAEIHEEKAEQGAWGRATEKTWSVRTEKGVWWRVVEVVPQKPPRSLAGFLGRWLANHGCAAKEVKDLPPLSHEGLAPVQLAFGGSCKGGDLYLIRVALLGDRAYEFHVDTGVASAPADLRAEMKALLEQVEFKKGATGAPAK